VYGCLRQVGCLIKVTANSGLTVWWNLELLSSKQVVYHCKMYTIPLQELTILIIQWFTNWNIVYFVWHVLIVIVIWDEFLCIYCVVIVGICWWRGHYLHHCSLWYLFSKPVLWASWMFCKCFVNVVVDFVHSPCCLINTNVPLFLHKSVIFK